MPPASRLGAYEGVGWSPYLGRPVCSLIFLMRRAPGVRTFEEIVDRYRLEMILSDRELPRKLRVHLAATYAGRDSAVPGTPFVLYQVRPPRPTAPR